MNEAGADINIKAAGSNISPLIIAAARGNQKSLKILIKRGLSGLIAAITATV